MNTLDDLYREHILEHAREPRNFGALATFTHHSAAENVSCGDSLEVFLDVDATGSITALSWQGSGCAISMASASILSEQLVGKPLQPWLEFSAEEVLEKLELAQISTARQKCALLFWRAVVMSQ